MREGAFDITSQAGRANSGPLAPTEDAEENEVYDVEDSPRRAEVEKALLHKLDRRMSILILIYILNCECHSPSQTLATAPEHLKTSIEIMLRKSWLCEAVRLAL